MMSDMDTFTLRDLNRQPAKVLKTCDLAGEVRIRTRSGKVYSLKAESAPAKPNQPYPNFAERRKKLMDLGLRPLNKTETEEFTRWLRGEA